MINKPFDKIVLADIQELIAEKVCEGRTLDYKEQLPGKGTEDKKELAKDVSSFANAAGGDIIYGVPEEKDDKQSTVLPGEIVPISGETDDDAILRIEKVIRSNVSPPPRVHTKAFRVDGGYILLLRVPQSFSAPHMVTTNGMSRFFSRSSKGKHQLDVHEIRNAFVASESITDRMQQFHQNRLAMIVANEGPATYLVDAPKIVIHILPISAFGRPEGRRLTSRDLLGADRIFIPPVGWSGSRINSDGLLCYYSMANEPTTRYSYCQAFSNGVVEAVDAFSFQPGDDAHFLDDTFEEKMVMSVDRYLRGLQELQIEPPLLIMGAVLDAKGSFLARDFQSRSFRRGPLPIDRDHVALPDVLVEEFDELRLGPNAAPTEHAMAPLQFVAQTLRPIIDGIWNAAGSSGSGHYDEKTGFWS